MHADFWAKNHERPVDFPHALFPPQLEVDDGKAMSQMLGSFSDSKVTGSKHLGPKISSLKSCYKFRDLVVIMI